jgi:parallel beta-helix repeat protein
MKLKRGDIFNVARNLVVVCIAILGLLTIIGTGGGGGGGNGGGGGDTTSGTASGTYTLTGDTLTLNTTSSDFPTDHGPAAGGEEHTVSSITATTMTWTTGGAMTWTRGSGTADDITGTWETTADDGWTYELTINDDGTFTVTGSESGTPVTLVSIAVTPANPSIAIAGAQQFTATGTYSDSSTDNITTEVAWNSSDTLVATIDDGGSAAALAAGTTTITATLGSASGSTTLTVTSSGGSYTGGTIRIHANDEFTATNGVVSGSGTQSDPFIIEGWTIDASSCDTGVWPYIKVGIAVGSTSKYFVIRNCSVSNADTYGCGISLTLLSNGTVQNCTLANDYTGISIDGCSNVVIADNTVQNCYDGISNGTYASDGITISTNTITNCTNTGIRFHYLTNSSADSNTVTNNGGTGIYVSDCVSSTPAGCIISNNSANGNDVDGIDVNDSQNVKIDNNITNSNGGDGIGVWCSFNIIHGNTSSNNTYEGIRLDYVGLTSTTASNNAVGLNNASFNGGDGLYVGLNCVNNNIYQNELSNNNQLGWASFYDLNIGAQPNTLSMNVYGTSYIAL